MKIYGIGGLGADERVFKFLTLNIHPIKWISPLEKESLEDYTKKLAQQINPDEPFILMGVSFGGIIAVELNKHLNPEKTIIISSAASKEELPWLITILRKVKLTNLIGHLPAVFLQPPDFLVPFFFGVKSEKEKVLLKEIIRDTNPHFLKWAIQKIINLENLIIPERLVRIHGDNDRLLKMNNGLSYKVVRGGGHFMIVTQAEIISNLIKAEFATSKNGGTF